MGYSSHAVRSGSPASCYNHVCRPSTGCPGWRPPPCTVLRFDHEASPFTILCSITAAYPDLQRFRLLIINSARGLSTQQLLWHPWNPSYILLGENSLQRFGLRPHGIVEVLAGEVLCGTCLTLSRDAVILCCHRKVHVSAARKLQRTFADLPTLRFHVTYVYPTKEWIEPVMTPLMHYMIVVFDPPESAFTPVLVRIWMPPLIQVGAVHCHRFIHKIALWQQFRLLRLADMLVIGAPATSTPSPFKRRYVGKAKKETALPAGSSQMTT